jgi:hypothetical protein
LLDVTADSVTFFAADAGRGLGGTNEEIAELNSIRRRLASSKMPGRAGTQRGEIEWFTVGLAE